MRPRAHGRLSAAVRAASVFLGAALVLAVSGAFLPDALVNGIDLSGRLLPPSAVWPLGSDELGRAIGWRLWRGASLSLGVAGSAVVFSAVLGSALGLFAGERGGVFDTALGKLTDLVLAFPGLLLAVALAAVLGPAASNTVIALSAVGWVPYARLARTEARRVRALDYVAAARSAGAGQLRLLLRHLLPNIAAPLVVQATLHLAGAILAESALSFLGVGVPPPAPSWGAMLAAGRTHILDAPHVVLAPALAILAVVLATNVVGDALVERLDVARRA